MVIRKHCIELDDANKFNAKIHCTTQSCLFFFFFFSFFLGVGSMCLPILSPKPVAETSSVDFIGRRRLRASFI